MPQVIIIQWEYGLRLCQGAFVEKNGTALHSVSNCRVCLPPAHPLGLHKLG